MRTVEGYRVAAAPNASAPRAKDVFSFVALATFAAVMYAIPGEWIPGASSLRLALVSSGLAAGLMFIRRIGKMEPLSLDGVRGFGLIMLTALAFGSISWSVEPMVSRGMALDLLKLTAIYLTIVNVVTTPRRLAILAGTLVIASIVTSVGVIQYYKAGINLSEGFRARWIGVYADPNHMAMDLAIIVPLAIAFLVRRDSGVLVRLLCATSALLALVAIVFSHSRGGFIGLACAMAVWAFREKRRMQAFVCACLLGVGLVVFAPSSFWQRNETVKDFKADASAMGRVHAWNVASRISIDKPLLGVGAGAFKYAWPLYAPPEAKRAYVAHNVFLDVIGELGWIGMFFFLLFVGGAAGGAFEASSSPAVGWLGRAISASVVGYLICDLFSGYLLSAHFYVLFGLAGAAARMAKAPVPVRVRGPRHATVMPDDAWEMVS
ncbi:MAG: O-antigen ligase family protein [Myxococcaceae bacterium]